MEWKNGAASSAMTTPASGILEIRIGVCVREKSDVPCPDTCLVCRDVPNETGLCGERGMIVAPSC